MWSLIDFTGNTTMDKLGAPDVAVASSISKIFASTLTYPHEVWCQRSIWIISYEIFMSFLLSFFFFYSLNMQLLFFKSLPSVGLQNLFGSVLAKQNQTNWIGYSFWRIQPHQWMIRTISNQPLKFGVVAVFTCLSIWFYMLSLFLLLFLFIV